MDEKQFRLTVLGARGSIPVSGPDYAVFGGNTSCYMVQAGCETVFLDGGSGLINAPTRFERPPQIFLSHFHLDHILGLGMYRRFLMKDEESVIYVPGYSAQQGKAILDGAYSPPYWPLSLTGYAGKIEICSIPKRLSLGELEVETAYGFHPGECYLFRLRFRGKTLVYATDCEPGDEEETAAVTEFARDADLLLFDGQYTHEEYEERKGFGHSTPEKGIEIMERAGVKRLLLIHHDPHSTDDELAERERRINRDRIRFAREGETIDL